MINNKLNKALTYASNQRKELSEFLNDGRIPLTNSLAERSIRPFAVHRKNWLFADSVEGANANAVMYSIIESAKINKLNIEKYIKYLLEEIQTDSPERIADIILHEAIDNDFGKAKDDMTVIAFKVNKK